VVKVIVPIPVAERSEATVCCGDRLLGLRVRIPPGTWKCTVSVAFCQVEVCATGRLLVQRSPTDCDVSLCVYYKPKESGGPGPRWAVAPEEKKKERKLMRNCDSGTCSNYVIFICTM
jgi:hypothetical protein